MKKVMDVQMFNDHLTVYHDPGKTYEFKVYRIIGTKRRYHLDSFESFQEALELVTQELYA